MTRHQEPFSSAPGFTSDLAAAACGGAAGAGFGIADETVEMSARSSLGAGEGEDSAIARVSTSAASRQPRATVRNGTRARRISLTGIGKLMLANSSRKTSMKPLIIEVPPEQTTLIGARKVGMF